MKWDYRYSLIIKWSEEDQAFIASCPELPGLLAHGDTHEEAAREAEDAMTGIVCSMKDHEMDLPEPRLFKFEERHDA
jgi:predicted RNase H-like HicB family nuclease